MLTPLSKLSKLCKLTMPSKLTGLALPLLLPLLLLPLVVVAPARAQTALRVVTHDRLLPKTCLAAVSLAPLAEHMDELAKTGLYKLLAPAWKDVPQQALGQILGRSGISEQHLRTMLTHGITFAWTGIDPAGEMSWLLIANLGKAEHDIRLALGATMANIRLIGIQPRRERFRSGDVWIIKIPDGGPRLVYTIRNGALIAGGSRTEVEVAVTKLLNRRGESLADNSHYASFCSRQEKLGKPVFTAYVQPTIVGDELLSLVPQLQRLRARQALGQLQLYKMRDLAFTLRAKDGLLHELFWLTYPAPRSGLLANLLGSSRSVKIQVAEHISPDAISASVYHIDFGQIYESLVSLSGVFSHEAPQQINMLTSNLETRSGVSLTKDVLEMLSDQVVVQQWSVPRSRSTNMAITIKLHDELRFRNALERLAKLAPVQKYRIRGVNAYSLDLPGMPAGVSPYLLAYRGHLVFATTHQARDKVMANLDSPHSNRRFAELLSNLSAEPNSISWCDCARLGKELANTVSVQFGNPLAARELQRILEETGGEMIAVTRQTKDGFVVKGSSPYGNVYLSVAFALGLRSAIQELPGATRVKDPSEAQTQRLSALLREVSDAQKLYRASGARDNNKNGVGEYGPIPDLINTQCLPRELVGRSVGDGVYQINDYLIKVMLPRRPENQERRFAAIAWPRGRERGRVFAITEVGLPQVNHIIAQAEGITDCDPRDLFLDGEFDQPLVEGWRPVATASEAARRRLTAAKDALRAQEAAERRHYMAILEAERTKRVTPDAIRALESTNAAIAARAAYLMGTLKSRDAVPSLCQLATMHEEIEVRRQAMAALTKIRDTRSIATSIRVLTNSDITVRAYAATNLGRLRALAAVKPLTTLLSTPVEGDGSDRIAALLALTDIGDPRCLALASASVKNPDTKLAEALTYMFQKVSPTMEPEDEVKPLLAALESDCLMLRRYVIQRLGVLKDPTTVTALENRLAKEDRQLQPLISVSLAAIRGEGSSQNLPFKTRMKAWVAQIEKRWESLRGGQRSLVIGSIAAVFLLAIMFLVWRSRHQRRRVAETWANMVNPSDGYDLEHAYDDLGYDESGYDEHAYEEAYDGHDFDAPDHDGHDYDGHYDEGHDYDGHYDTEQGHDEQDHDGQDHDEPSQVAAASEHEHYEVHFAEGDLAEGGLAERGLAEADLAGGGFAGGCFAEGELAERGLAEGGLHESDQAEGDHPKGDPAAGGIDLGGIFDDEQAPVGGNDQDPFGLDSGADEKLAGFDEDKT
ncbi:MAG: HEAT repeat domain-containing protein [Planctomycetota bacterium]|jgi:HEAT repeat protein